MFAAIITKTISEIRDFEIFGVKNLTALVNGVLIKL